MPAIAIHHEEDPRTKLLRELGDISSIEIFNNQVLVATYIRPKTAMLGGKIFELTDKTVDEDQYQSKVGLILKAGSAAFYDPNGVWFQDAKPEVGDWIIFRNSDGWKTTIRKKECKMLSDVSVRGRVQHPDDVY